MHRSSPESAFRVPLLAACALAASFHQELPALAVTDTTLPADPTEADRQTTSPIGATPTPPAVAVPEISPPLGSPLVQEPTAVAQSPASSQTCDLSGPGCLKADPVPLASGGAAAVAPEAIAVPEMSFPTSVASPAPVAVAPTPTIAQTPVNETVAATTTLTDIENHWAEPFIQPLVDRGVIRGFPDRAFRPDAPVTRAQFAALVQQAFSGPAASTGGDLQFIDVTPRYWAYQAIQTAYRLKFLNGYPSRAFQPDQAIPRVQVLVSLVRGLALPAPTQTVDLEATFADGDEIPDYASSSVVAALENRMLVNYPNVREIDPNRAATRAEVAAMIYQALVRAGQLPALPETVAASRFIAGTNPIAQSSPNPEPPPAPSPEAVQSAQTRLQQLQATRNFGNVFQGSPAITIANPAGFGADDLTAFISGTYQSRTRYTDQDDGALAFGIGLGDSRRTIGAELSYTLSSFGGSRDFGTGGFNLKLHRQFPQDWSVALGWNGFITTGEVDYRNSVYGAVTKVLRTRPDVNQPFSRVALTAGVGSGQFRSESDVLNDRDTVGIFGSVAVRVAQPVSLIAEWTGQDLALGLSIVPIKGVNWVITPAVRDIAGAGDGARFVLGTGFSWKF